MLAVETTHNWAFAVDVTVGAATETYTNAATDADSVAAVAALVAWANAAGRAWFGTRTFAWTWARQSSTGAALLTLSATGGTFSITGGASSTLGFAAAAGVTTTTGTAAAGSWAPKHGPAVSGDVRVLEAGDACGGGAVRPGVPGLACRSPKVEAVGTPIDAARLAAVLALAANPRRCRVWQLVSGTWIELALGQVQRSAQGATLYSFRLDCAGDPV